MDDAQLNYEVAAKALQKTVEELKEDMVYASQGRRHAMMQLPAAYRIRQILEFVRKQKKLMDWSNKDIANAWPEDRKKPTTNQIKNWLDSGKGIKAENLQCLLEVFGSKLTYESL